MSFLTPRDEFVPTLIIRNSYDKTASFSITYGGFRFVCENGVMIGDKVHEIRMLHRGEEIDFEELRKPFIERIAATIDCLRTTYKKPNHADGHPYFEMMLLEDLLAKKYRKLMINEMTGYEQVQYDEDEDGKLQPIASKQRKEFSAYLLWNILTSTATHKVKSAQARYRMQQVIAQKFMS